jgi:hypothetical protein
MALSRKPKMMLILAPFLGLLLVAGALGARYWWYRGYAQGSRTGVVRKISVKGPPYCKYLSGEMVVQSTSPVQPAEVWEFSVDDDSDGNPLVSQLHDAERKGDRVTLDYRQDLHSLYRCTPSEYFVTKVEK